MTISIARKSFALGAVAALGLAGAATQMRAQGPAMPAYLAAFPHFAANLTPQMPGDVDTTLKSKLEASGDFPLVQREFDLYAWQMFVAVNWPTDAGGRAAPQFSATAFGAPRWNSWPVSSDVFRVDGARPTACGPSRPGAKAMMASPADANLPVSRGLPPFQLTSTNKGASLAAEAPGRPLRRLGVVSAVGELNAANLNEIDQAFSGPLIDRNGEFVFYEIAIDPNEVSYLCQNGLYNINGQVAFTGAGQKVNMPSGTPGAEWSGSWELKFAWRIMGKGDDPSRFYTTPAIVWDQGSDGKPVQRRVTVGLVGLHIGHKSATSPQWIWATFEQTDNLDVDPVAHPKLSASFSNADCPICAVNQLPRKVNGVYSRVPTQAWRAIPIPGDKQKGEAKTARLFAKHGIAVVAAERLPKPAWIRARAPSSPRFAEIKRILRENSLHTVCEEASCPNIGECFSKGTATFMIMGDICTRRCPFCDVGHGRPLPLDVAEPDNLARTIAALELSYVVITSVDRDDLRDGGAQHFVDCIRAVRSRSPQTQIEVLVPDFRGRLDRALSIIEAAPPDVMNHNLETVPRLYREARPGSDYAHSLSLLAQFKKRFPDVPTKSGLMVGLGETDDEIVETMRDLRDLEFVMIFLLV
ncbi:MAG: lipoyl synthase [Allosphingosinicella sp.]